MTETITRSEFDDLIARVESLEQENERLTEENEQLNERVDRLEDHNEQLAKENAELKQRIADVEETADCAQGNSTGAHERINELKEQIEDATPTPDGVETAGQRHETPLEQVVAMPEHIVEGQLTANQERARFIASSIPDYATKVQSGDYILRAGDLRSVLKAAYDTAHSETVDRVRTILADLGDDDVELQEPRTAGFSPDTKAEKRRQGKKLVVSSSLVRRLSKIDHDVVTEAAV